MDITKSISHLLYYHDCIIIPGFGGFVCSYRQAQIHPVLHSVTPPSKAISFNINLRSNDGLLANHLVKATGVTYQQALQGIDSWVTSSVTLLDSEKELKLRNIGRLVQDVEGGWQFTPDESVNYLTSSFGLPVITAAPVLRGREVAISERAVKPEIPTISSSRNHWKIAASVILIAGISLLSGLMFTGHVIKPLTLNEAGVMSALLHFSGNNVPDLKPIPPVVTEPVKTENKALDNAQATGGNTVAAAPHVVKERNKTADNSAFVPSHSYYVIVGVFASHYNIEKARKHILSTVPASSLYEETYNGLTRIGYLAGNDADKAKEELVSARAADTSCWLLQK